MLKMFNYNKKDVAFNDIIDETVAFAAAQYNNEAIENKEERLKVLNENIVKYCAEGTRYESLFEEKGCELAKDPRVTKNANFQENFNAVIAEIVNPILPMVSNQDFVRFLAETRQIGWGDTARFIVHSNELYKVNEVAEGITRGVLQPIHDNEITINTKNVEIVAEVDWYQVAAGVFDFGDFGLRCARSFEQYIFLQIVAAFTSAFGVNGAAYSASGFTNANWSQIAQKVGAANGGSQVWAMGTLAALNGVIDSRTGLQYGLGEKMNKDGYLDRYLGCRLVCIDQAFGTPYGVNVDGALALPDDVIYFLAVGAYRPLGIVYEGDSVIVERDVKATPDKTYRVKIGMRIGVGAILGSKFGKLDLAAE